jgi:hypothetical protein
MGTVMSPEAFKELQQKTLLKPVRLFYTSDKDFKILDGTVFCDLMSCSLVQFPYTSEEYIFPFPGSSGELATC